MTQVNFTLTQEEVLRFLSGNRDEAFKMLVKRILDRIMLAESSEKLGAGRQELFKVHCISALQEA